MYLSTNNLYPMFRIYNGYLDCVRQILKTEGPGAFNKGLVAQYMR